MYLFHGVHIFIQSKNCYIVLISCFYVFISCGDILFFKRYSTFTSFVHFANLTHPTHFNQLLCQQQCMQRVKSSHILKRYVVFSEYKRWRATPNIFLVMLTTSQSSLVPYNFCKYNFRKIG